VFLKAQASPAAADKAAAAAACAAAENAAARQQDAQRAYSGQCAQRAAEGAIFTVQTIAARTNVARSITVETVSVEGGYVQFPRG
jgi:hypothetical protein